MRKETQLKERQYESNELIKNYDVVDDKLSKKLLDFINVTTNAYETFKGSTIAKKRKFLNLAFPFNELEKVVNCTEWLPGPDSNQRPNG